MTLSPELIKVYASGGVNETWVECLTITHPQFTAPWNITNSPYMFIATTETGASITFSPYPFQASLAGTGESGNQDVEIVISNVEKTPIDEIERAAEDPTQQIQMVYRIWLESKLDSPGYVVDGLSISEVNITETEIVARASASDMLNRSFPTVLYTPAKFPGLYHV